jgi:hypothetical protein
VQITVESWLGGSWAARGSSRLDGFALPASTPLLDALGYGPKSLHRFLPFLYFAVAADTEGAADLAPLALAMGFVYQAHTSGGSASARVRQAEWPIATRVPAEREACCTWSHDHAVSYGPVARRRPLSPRRGEFRTDHGQSQWFVQE